MNVFPNFGAIGASAKFTTVIGALLMIVLIASVLMLVISAAIWAISSTSGNPHTAMRARTGVWVALGAAILAGAATALMNFLLGVGGTL